MVTDKEVVKAISSVVAILKLPKGNQKLLDVKKVG